MQTKDDQSLYLQSPRLNQLNILREVAANAHVTQAELARRCSLSVAMVNNYMKELCGFGLLEYHRKTAKSVTYHLTASGTKHLEALQWRQLEEMVGMFVAAKDQIRKRIDAGSCRMVQRVVVIGVGNLAQLAFHALELSGANILGICGDSPETIGRDFCGREVLSPSQIRFLAPDAVVVTEPVKTEDMRRILESLSARGINVIQLNGAEAEAEPPASGYAMQDDGRRPGNTGTAPTA